MGGKKSKKSLKKNSAVEDQQHQECDQPDSGLPSLDQQPDSGFPSVDQQPDSGLPSVYQQPQEGLGHGKYYLALTAGMSAQQTESSVLPLTVQPPVPNLNAPQKISAQLEYVLEGKLKDFGYGYTSLASRILDRRIGISTISFANLSVAYDYMFNVRACTCESVVECYCIDDSNIGEPKVLVERIESDFKSWIDAEYGSWERSRSTKGWWQSIRQKFKSMFRGILQVLRHIYRLGYYCGKVLDGIAVMNNRPKLVWVKKPLSNKEFDDGSLKDIHDLRDLMRDFLFKACKDCNDWDGTQETGYFARQGVPKDLQDFVFDLYKESYIREVNLQWLLDHSFFWDPVTKTTFIRKLWDRLLSPYYLETYHMDQLIDEKFLNWRLSIPSAGDRAKQIFSRIEADRILQKSKVANKLGKEGSKVIESSSSKEMTRFYRQMLEHYNETLKNRKDMKEKDDISELVDGLWGGTCALLRCALEAKWDSSHSMAWNIVEDEREFFLSDRDF